MIEQAIYRKAAELGFATAGIVKIGPAQTHEIYLDWLGKSFHGGMEYLQRHAELKKDPRNLAPDAESIIAVAARYPTNTDPQDGGFSTYARGEDYHTVIRHRLRELAAFINEEIEPLKTARICVDSAPLLEREWALRSGIGWLGKQGQLVNPTAGCCMLLGFLLVDIELQPSEPLENRCGDCRLCLESCPTGALCGNATVDARRCLSYLTIEPSAEFPANMPYYTHGSLFGCDRCTAICPWNVKATATIMPELQQSGPLPTAEELQDWTEGDFKNRFKNSAVYRTGLEHLKLNTKK